eukprot:5306492-Prymnesium_polylepis.1
MAAQPPPCPSPRSVAPLPCHETAAAMIEALQPSMQPVTHNHQCGGSMIYVDQERRLALKRLNGLLEKFTPLEREACVLKRLQPFPWAPRLLCVGSDYLLTDYRGRPACRGDGYLELDGSVARAAVKHNDLKKSSDTDFVVDGCGRASLVDYGWVSLGDNLAMSCAFGGRHLRAGGTVPRSPELARGIRFSAQLSLSNYTTGSQVKGIDLPLCNKTIYKADRKMRFLGHASDIFTRKDRCTSSRHYSQLRAATSNWIAKYTRSYILQPQRRRRWLLSPPSLPSRLP